MPANLESYLGVVTLSALRILATKFRKYFNYRSWKKYSL